MRLLIAMLIAFSAVADGAEARSKSRSAYVCRDCGPPVYRRYVPPQRYYRPYRESEHSDSYDCIVARSLDPGGNYADYPCWAQKALAPKKQF